MGNILSLILLIFIILTSIVLWTLTFRKCFKRSIPFSIIISIVLGWIALGAGGGLTATIDEILFLCLGIIIYIFYFVSPFIFLILIRDKKISGK